MPLTTSPAQRHISQIFEFRCLGYVISQVPITTLNRRVLIMKVCGGVLPTDSEGKL